MLIRKATADDISAIEKIYLDTHSAEERGETTTCWIRGVYPTRKTAEDALLRDDLFVMEDNGRIVGTAVINQIQMDVYPLGNWQFDVPEDKITVLHTLIISPSEKGKGYGRNFVSFYENYAKETGCPFLRMDTNEKNIKARELYKKLGYAEIGIVPCVFHGIENVMMVLLEKYAD